MTKFGIVFFISALLICQAYAQATNNDTAINADIVKEMIIDLKNGYESKIPDANMLLTQPYKNDTHMTNAQRPAKNQFETAAFVESAAFAILPIKLSIFSILTLSPL